MSFVYPLRLMAGPSVFTTFIAVVTFGLSSAAGDREVGPGLPPSDACNALSSPRTLLTCVRARAPSALSARAHVQEQTGRLAQARELANPGLYAQIFRSGPGDPAGDAVQSSVLFPIDTWGVRSTRMRKASYARSASELDARLSEEDLVRHTLLALHRIRQTRTFVAQSQEQNAGIRASLNAFKRRTSLAPEQEATRLTLSTAAAAEESRLALLQQDLEGLAHDVAILIGVPWQPNESTLPPETTNWPTLELPRSAENPSVSDSSPRRAQAALRFAEADEGAALAKAERRPPISVGPSAEWSRTSVDAGWRAGIVAQIGLPILDSRAGSAQAAAAEAARLRVEAEGAWREARGDAEHALEVYLASVEKLKALEPRAAALDRLRKTRGLFARGLVAGSTYLEAHRQTRELLQARADLELRAVDSRCITLAYAGRFEECLP